MPEIDFEGSAAIRVAPGLSSFAAEPEKAGEMIRELVEFGKGRVPRDLWGDTEVRLMATAGLRLLDVGAQERILDACRKVLKFSGFRFQDDWASVISGKLFFCCWITEFVLFGSSFEFMILHALAKS